MLLPRRAPADGARHAAAVVELRERGVKEEGEGGKERKKKEGEERKKRKTRKKNEQLRKKNPVRRRVDIFFLIISNDEKT